MRKADPAARMQRLLVRSDALRAALALQAQRLKSPLAFADKVRAGVQWVCRNPVLPLGAGLLLAVLLPKRTLFGIGGRVWRAWTVYNRVHKAVATKPKPRRPPS